MSNIEYLKGEVNRLNNVIAERDWKIEELKNRSFTPKDVWGWLDEWEGERVSLLQHYADDAEEKVFLFDLGSNAFKSFLCRKLEELEEAMALRISE